MPPNRLKRKLQQGQPAAGVWLTFMDPNLIEFYGHLGFDYVIIDAEHQAVDKANCLELVRACDVVGLSSIVRPDNRSSGTILGFLDLGADGIYAPHVQSASDAREVVKACKYAPIGSRSMNYPRPMKYGITESPREMYENANQETMVIVLVEEPEGIAHLDEIIAVEGVDVVGIGDGDLSHAMGFVGDKANPKLRHVVEDAEHRVRAAGKPFDAVVSSAEGARQAIDGGATMISLSDRLVLQNIGKEFTKVVAGSGSAALRN